MRNREEIAPKPYEFVPFPARTRRDSPAGHHRFGGTLLSGVLEVELVALSPLQVGSGRIGYARGQQGEVLALLPSTVGREGARGVIVPGSSLKGAVRSLCEALSPSCVLAVTPLFRNFLPDGVRRCTQVTQLCPACRLFGMSGTGGTAYGGSVQFEDALAPTGRVDLLRTPLLWTPARGTRGLPPVYLHRGVAKGRKLYYHGKLPAQPATPEWRQVLRKDTVLSTRLRFENLSPGLLGLLLTSLGLHPGHRFPIKVGAGKPVGMGSVQVRVKAAVVHGSVAQRGRLGGAGGPLPDEEWQQLMESSAQKAEADGLINHEALGEVEQVLQRRNLLEREAPGGLY